MRFSGDISRRNILELIPLCNDVYKLHSLCYNCKNGTNGDFTKRMTSSRLVVILWLLLIALLIGEKL